MDKYRREGDGELAGVLEDVARRYEEVWHENAELRERVDELDDELAAYRKLDQQLREAVVVACNAADEARRAAEDRLEAARLDAEDIVRGAEERLKALEAEIALRERAKDPANGYRKILADAFQRRLGLTGAGVPETGNGPVADASGELRKDPLET